MKRKTRIQTAGSPWLRGNVLFLHGRIILILFHASTKFFPGVDYSKKRTEKQLGKLFVAHVFNRKKERRCYIVLFTT